MNLSEIKSKADKILSQVGISAEFKKLRKRYSEVGGYYYGSHFYNEVEVTHNAPDYLLTRDGLTGSIRYKNDLFTVWAIETDKLKKIVRIRSNYFIDWTFFSYVLSADKSVAFVFPKNRYEFAAELKPVLLCSDLK